MRNKRTILLALTALIALTACNDYETYGEKKEKERDNIDKFIADSAFNIITEEQFIAQGEKTSVEKREFVLLSKSGVYMQIIREGTGKLVADGESTNLLCRFSEMSIEDYQIVYNDKYYVYDVDKMFVQRQGSTFTARFTSGKMFNTYGSSVPEGWLVPLNYVKVGRLVKPDDELAKVRLIVPHSKGHSIASQYVRPYFYEITFEKER